MNIIQNLLCFILGVEGKGDPEKPKSKSQKWGSWFLGFIVLIFVFINAGNNHCRTVMNALEQSVDAYHKSLDQRFYVLDAMINDQKGHPLSSTLINRFALKSSRDFSNKSQDRFYKYHDLERNITGWVKDHPHSDSELQNGLNLSQEIVDFYQYNVQVQLKELLRLKNHFIGRWFCKMDSSEWFLHFGETVGSIRS